MKRKIISVTIGVVLVAATIVVFARYIAGHQDIVRQLGRIAPLHVAELLTLYAAWFAAMALTAQASLRLCRMHMPIIENVLLNAYSTLVNFAVPGQGGIAVRGAYLKRRHNLSLRRYILATLIYYAFYVLASTVMVLAPTRPWWQTCGGILATGLASAAAVRWYARRSKQTELALELSPTTLGLLAVATIFQAVAQVAIYGVELHIVDPHAGLGQVLSYTGVANFSLFVALTPSGIGIRESFLLLSQQLHHVATATIVTASVIDRGVFIVFLGVLFVVSLGLHAKQRLHAESSQKHPGKIYCS